MEIKGDTTFSALLEDPRTAPVFKAYLAEHDKGSDDTVVGDMGAAAKEMAEAMFQGFPLKSLFSFGMGTREEAEKLIADLKKAVE